MYFQTQNGQIFPTSDFQTFRKFSHNFLSYFFQLVENAGRENGHLDTCIAGMKDNLKCSIIRKDNFETILLYQDFNETRIRAAYEFKFGRMTKIQLDKSLELRTVWKIRKFANAYKFGDDVS